MNLPLFVRPLADSEQAVLRHGLRSPEAFTLRRCQILLLSHQGRRPSQIAVALGCTAQTVRDALRAFARRGLDCLRPLPKTPKTIHAVWSSDRDDDLRALLHQSPRTLGKPTSLWTLPLAAQVCYEKGWTTRRLSGEAIRLVLQRLGVGWTRAKHWRPTPDRRRPEKKGARSPVRGSREPCRLGPGLPGRDLVDASGPAESVRRGRRATAAVAGPRAWRRSRGVGRL